ncbi:expressed unknown protein [Seminavis robusta]|uniref:Uncharacterized protein n=1 Tax=Seminavis robusta TaxID=568900 RepID=A0A9N8H3H1_9STRA|nr:expressed unknown protein [Seminavis robusta]|eukprot:Sro26_g017730.1 n/a (1251) ;mRNA; r:110797-114549
MAMYIETTRDGRPQDATTLEEAAEELLNGLLCHYEPPDPRTVRKMQEAAGSKKSKHRSILRASTKLFRPKRNKRQKAKSVRWKDEQHKSQTPDIYDIGKGCQDALAECGPGNDADYNLQKETERLAELTSQRTPKPIGKRIRGKDYDDDDDEDDDDDGIISDDPSAGKGGSGAVNGGTTNPSSSLKPSSYGNSNGNSGNGNNNKSSSSTTKKEADNDPISAYRIATISPKTDDSHFMQDDVPDDVSSLFDDQGNVVMEAQAGETTKDKTEVSKYGPPPSPTPTPPTRSDPRNDPRNKPRQSRQRQERHRYERQVPSPTPGTLCGIMCDPKYINCDVGDPDGYQSYYDGYARPPPPPPPLPGKSNHYYRYDEPDNSLISASDGEESTTVDSEGPEPVTPTKRSFRERFRRKSKKNKASPPSSPTGRSDDGTSSAGGSKAGKFLQRVRGRSPGRRGRSRSKSPGRVVDESKVSDPRKDRKFPLSPMSFITGNRSFSRSPRAKAARDQMASESEANYSMASGDSSSRRTSKSPLKRRWFGSRGRKQARDQDWDYPSQGQLPYGGQIPHTPSRGRSLERQSQIGLSRSQSYDKMDPIDRAGMSDFDTVEMSASLHPSRSRSLDRQDRPQQQQQRGRTNSYERAESHIGLSRLSFDNDDMLRPSRSRSLDRQDQGLSQTRSRSLERHDPRLQPSRSRSLDRQDSRSHSSGSNGRPQYDYPRQNYDADPYFNAPGARYQRPPPPMESRRQSYPLVPASSYPYPVPSDNRHQAPPMQPAPHWSQRAQPPPPLSTRDDYVNQQQYQQHAMNQRTGSYPPPQGVYQQHPMNQRTVSYPPPQTTGVYQQHPMNQRTGSYPPPQTTGVHLIDDRASFDYTGTEPKGRVQSWWSSRQQRKTAAEPPAAIYSHQPQQQQQQPHPPLPHQQQYQPAAQRTFYSHDPQPTAHAITAVQGRDVFPPTPMQRDQYGDQYGGQKSQQYPQQMPATPALRSGIHSSTDNSTYDKQNDLMPRRDPTPRGNTRSLFDFVRSPLLQQQPVRQPSPPLNRPFNVAEEIHRVSWGQARRTEEAQDETLNQTPEHVNYADEQQHVHYADNEPELAKKPQVVEQEQPQPRIPSTLPGKKEKPIPPPPPPPPPLTQSRPHPQPQDQVPPQNERPPFPTKTNSVPEDRPPPTNANSVPEDRPVEFSDTVDENRMPPAQKKEGKGRKLLGLFGRGKRKQKQRVSSGYSDAEGTMTDEMDDSIFSDAVLRDRHDRYKTQI